MCRTLFKKKSAKNM